MGRLLILALATLLLAACSGPEPTPTPSPSPTSTPTHTPIPRDPQEAVNAFVQAFNAGDIEAIAAIFADEIVFSMEPLVDRQAGKAAVLASTLAIISDRWKIALSNTSIEGSTLVSEISFRYPQQVCFGLGPLTGIAEYVVQEDKLASITYTFSIPTANGFTPLMDMTADDTYKGEDGGLYGSGLNEPPLSHRSAALKEIAKIQPSDGLGNPSPDGKIVIISIGMSNTSQEFTTFKQLADIDPQKSSELVIVNGAQSGQTACTWANFDEPWQVLEQRLEANGLSPQQVQVAWVKQANAVPTEPFPTEAKKLQGHLATIMKLLKERYPNVRVVYVSSRIYGGYAATPLSPEPYAYEGAFSVRWLIQDQINGDPDLNYDPGKGPVNAPLLLWVPYLWADDLNPRSDGLIWERGDLAEDGIHPSSSGEEKVARMLLDFFKTDDSARPWFVESR